MSGPVNYDDVLEQLRAAGLAVDAIEPGRLRRCRVEGDDREPRGWYSLHEIRLSGGDLALVGAFGIWHGNSNNAQKIELKKFNLNADQKEAIRKRIRDDQRRAAAARQRVGEQAAVRALSIWKRCREPATGGAGVPYLEEKRVGAHGVRATETGTLVVPMCDAHGRVHGLQFIGPEVSKRRGRNKDFFPFGVIKRGRFHLIGAPQPGGVLLVAEGYATAASLYENSGQPVAVAFDAGNLVPVCEALQRKYPRTRILVCGDDDWLGKCRSCQKLTPTESPTCQHCGADSSMLENAGKRMAEAAALAVAGAALLPVFMERAGRKLTDFNDLQVIDGAHAVRAQVEAKIEAEGWTGAPAPRVAGGAGGGAALKPNLTVDEANERLSLIYGGRGTLFDHHEHELVPKGDVLDLLQDHGWKEWKTRNDRRVVRMTEVGFDPTEKEKGIRCNLWGGWPTTPIEGACSALLELLEYLCSSEKNPREITDWVLRWLAYPIQHPGAKMKTALIFHGPQGVGKNLFFEAVMAIYGQYGRIVDQSAIEDKFNDWASKKLFLIGDEVIARQELYHVKGKLKALITGDWIRINPKNVAAHDERNHVNIVFLSNERQPLVVDRDDRRYTVIWTPEKLSRDFYNDVAAELAAGGVAALHHHLATMDLGDFKPWTPPPLTAAKQELIDVSMDSVERFIAEWTANETPWPFSACASMDLYQAYSRWCRMNGVARPRESNQMLGHIGKLPGWTNRPRHVYEDANCNGETRPRRVVVPPDPLLAKVKRNQPPGDSVAAWLTGAVFEFRLALNDDRPP